MDTPVYSPKQYLSSTALTTTDALLSASVVSAIEALCGIGFIEYEQVSFTTPTALLQNLTFGTQFLAIFPAGLSQAHGTTPNSDTQTYSVNLAPFVPTTGSQTVFMYLTYFSLGMAPITIVGPPSGHPNYDPTFQPYSANTFNRDSFSLLAGTSLPAGSLEMARTTLTAGQIGSVVLDQSHVIKSAAYSAGRLLSVQEFTSSGTYTPTPGTNSIVVEGVGGGGAGGGIGVSGTFASAGAGGCAGAYGRVLLTSGIVSTPITIGIAGAPVTGGKGGNGGTTSFGGTLIIPGGGGSPVGVGANGPLVTGTIGARSALPTGAQVGYAGQPGGAGIALSVLCVLSGAGGSGPFGSGGGQGGPTGPFVSNGQAASGFGAGGSGAVSVQSGTASAGGAGTPGFLRIHEYS